MHNDQTVWEELLQPRVYIKGSENISGGTGNLVKGVGQDWDIWSWRVCETDLVERLGRIFQAEGESTRGLGVNEAWRVGRSVSEDERGTGRGVKSRAWAQHWAVGAFLTEVSSNLLKVFVKTVVSWPNLQFITITLCCGEWLSGWKLPPERLCWSPW